MIKNMIAGREYSLLFAHREGGMEQMLDLSDAEAWHVFRMFAERDSSDVYEYVALRNNEQTIAVLSFVDAA